MNSMKMNENERKRCCFADALTLASLHHDFESCADENADERFLTMCKAYDKIRKDKLTVNENSRGGVNADRQREFTRPRPAASEKNSP
jgi:hypothetical protein